MENKENPKIKEEPRQQDLPFKTVSPTPFTDPNEETINLPIVASKPLGKDGKRLVTFANGQQGIFKPARAERLDVGRPGKPNNSRGIKGPENWVWHWHEAPVDSLGDHFVLRYGSARDSSYAEWLPVARIGPPSGSIFAVEFLIDRSLDDLKDVVEYVIRELDFYLTEVGGPDPWGYAKYHCTTAADAYSMVHWEFNKGVSSESINGQM
jgi:hypothetical protein